MASILLVDDKPELRALMARRLLAHGHLVREAGTAGHAIAILSQSSDVHVVIADVQTPDRGGDWLIEQLAAQFPIVAVVVATADDGVRATLSLQRSVVASLAKPVSTDHLLCAVSKALAWHQQQLQHTRARATDDLIDEWIEWINETRTHPGNVFMSRH
jgi:DNA-binding NtrC family response regulator